MTNYAFTTGKALPLAVDGAVFENCNFHQCIPHTKIFEGIARLTFKNCNLLNCDIPFDATMTGCNNGQVEYCGNMHAEWINKGVSACAENCSHVIASDEIKVAGVIVDIIHQYADKVVA